MSDQPQDSTVSAPSGGPSKSSVVRLVVLIFAFVAVGLALQLSGWNGPQQLQDIVESSGWAGVIVFVVGYALLVMAPTPASVLTILGGALFGLWWGAVVVWSGAMLGSLGGFLIGRLLGRDAVDGMLRGKLHQADQSLAKHGVIAVLTFRLVPIFPFTPLNYAAGVLGVRVRDYLLGTGLGIIPGSLAYVALGASGADPIGIVIGVSALIVLAVLGGFLGRKILSA